MPDKFYEQIKPRLHRRIGRQVRLAHQVVDIGCGSCDLVRYLAEANKQEVTGVDVSDDSFPSRRRTSNGQPYRCLKRDASRLGFFRNSSADAVVAMWSLHEMARPDATLQEACRLLRPGGLVLVVDFPRGSLAQRLWNEDYFRPREMQPLLENAGFERVKIGLIERRHVMWVRGHRPSQSRSGPGEPGLSPTNAEYAE